MRGLQLEQRVDPSTAAVKFIRWNPSVTRSQADEATVAGMEAAAVKPGFPSHTSEHHDNDSDSDRDDELGELDAEEEREADCEEAKQTAAQFLQSECLPSSFEQDVIPVSELRKRYAAYCVRAGIRAENREPIEHSSALAAFGKAVLDEVLFSHAY